MGRRIFGSIILKTNCEKKKSIEIQMESPICGSTIATEKSFASMVLLIPLKTKKAKAPSTNLTLGTIVAYVPVWAKRVGHGARTKYFLHASEQKLYTRYVC